MRSTTLITITGDRPDCFRLCEQWMQDQTFQDFHWIVVDNGQEETTPSMADEYIRLDPAQNPRESFRNGMVKALQAVRTHQIAFIEDDDYYHPFHLELSLSCLGRGRTRDAGKEGYIQLAGQARAKYYNFTHKMWKIHPNDKHASLCQTVICGEPMKQFFLKTLYDARRPETLDGLIWKHRHLKHDAKLLLPVSVTCVGMKSMPGRHGLGVGHVEAESLVSEGYQEDSDGSQLRQWVVHQEHIQLYEQLEQKHASIEEAP